MLIKPFSPGIFFSKLLKYLLLAVIGTIIILTCSYFQHLPLPPKGEYFYSSFFRNNFTLTVKIIFVITGLLVGYFYRLNPVYAGISFIFLFPITAVAEAFVYPGSHNLIPFEFVYHLWLALPSIAALFAGRLLSIRLEKRTHKTFNRIGH
jgi:hypothetical protein